jgi:hypothetical protein
MEWLNKQIDEQMEWLNKQIKWYLNNIWNAKNVQNVQVFQ